MDLTENKEKIKEFQERAKELVAQMTLEEKVYQMVHGQQPSTGWASRHITGGTKRFTVWQEPAPNRISPGNRSVGYF